MANKCLNLRLKYLMGVVSLLAIYPSLSCAQVAKSSLDTVSEKAVSGNAATVSDGATFAAHTAPLWEVGISGFAISRPAYPGSDTYVSRALVIPYFLYRGEHLRIERGGSGYRAVKTPRFEFDIGFSGALGSSSDKVVARRGMETIGHMIEFGPKANWYLTDPEQNGRWRFELPLRAVFDLSDGFRRRGYSVEPELKYDRTANGGWRYSAGVSSVWGSDQLADTFYRVRPDQVLADRPAYDAKAGLLAWRVFTSVSHQFDKDWRVFANLRIDSVVGAANEQSSLVRRKTAPSVLLGISYTWKQSERRSDE